MRQLAPVLSLLVCLTRTLHAETTRLAITFAGSPAGENVYVVNEDGTFTSNTTLILGTLQIKSDMTGKWVGKRITEFQCESTPPGKTVKTVISLKNGKLHASNGSSEKDLPTIIKDEPYFGNLHPQFTASVLSSVDFAKKSSQELKCFCPDLGVFLSPKFTPEGERITASGVARMFDMQLAPVAAEYALDSLGHVVAMDVPGQKLRFLTPGWEGLFKDPLASYPELSQVTYKYRVDKGVKMKTRDGVTLVQDIIRPDAPGKFPAILERTPYGRGSSAVEGPFYATRGYAFVVQDCRGRDDSEGEWDPFVHERKDGYDTVQWVANQPWCDANVGMIGGSYLGFVQWAAAAERPTALKCIVPQVSPPDAFLNLPYDNGVFFLWGAVWWSKIVAGKSADMSSFMSALPHPDQFKTLPLSKVDIGVLGRHVAFYDKWLSRDKASDWSGFNYEDDLKHVTIPALNVSGWWDGDEIGTMTNWEIMRGLGRKNQWLVYGPWTHLFNSTSKIGDEDFGSTAVIDLDSVYLRWFDTWLKHKDVGMEKLPHVRVFVTGSNKWIESSDWPLPNSKPMTLYLAASGSADGADSKGRLLLHSEAAQEPSKYTYDPKVAEIDKKLSDPDPNHASLVVELPKKATGLLLFKSDPMVAPMSIAGPIVFDLRFSTSARDTDFFASLVDIDEQGVTKAWGQPGKIRCSYLSGLSNPQPLHPGKIYQAKIRLWDVSHQFKKGHRVGLLLHSTMFPLYARNLGTAEPIKNATKMIVQDQKIYHDKKNPSSLTFQVIE